MIVSFRGEWRFLSNFEPCAVKLDGERYLSVEAAYQAAKTLDPARRRDFQGHLKPSLAKRMGQTLDLRPDWDEVRLAVMEDLLRQKFQRMDMRRLLWRTGDQILVEGNTWHDNFWGVCFCTRPECEPEGLNHLGRLLMKIRSEA